MAEVICLFDLLRHSSVLIFFLSLSSAFFPFIQPDSIFFWTSYSHNSFHLRLFLPWILHRLWNLCGRIFKVHHEVPAGILKNSGS